MKSGSRGLRPSGCCGFREETFAGTRGKEMTCRVGQIRRWQKQRLCFLQPISGAFPPSRCPVGVVSLGQQGERGCDEPSLVPDAKTSSEQRRERYLSPPNGFIVVLSLSSAR